MLILMAALMLAAFTEPPPLRLHVIAHSDSAADQRAKFMVRDAVLKVTEGHFELQKRGRSRRIYQATSE